MLLLRILNTLLPVVYALVAAEYARRLVRGDLRDRPLLLAVGATASVHLAAVLVRGFVLGHCPCVTGPEIVSMLALSMVVVYLGLEILTKVRSTGFFILAIVFLLQFFATALGTDVRTAEIPDALRTWQSSLHANLAVLGYAGFGIAAAHGLVYLVLYRSIRGHRYGPIFQKLPSLDVLDRLLGASTLVGLIFFTGAIATGAWNARRLDRPPWPAVTACLTWLIFVALVWLRRKSRWKGRRSAWLALAGLAFACLGLLISETLHGLGAG